MRRDRYVDGGRSMSHIELANTVEDVLSLLEVCIETAREEDSADAYFPLIYSWETRDIAQAATDGVFDAPDELRRTIVVFANRYFTARAQFRANRPTSQPWALAFRAARSSSALVIQHLLLAMNAHINVDLAAATAETGLPWLDYSRVDAILGRGVGKIQGRLNRTTVLLRALDLMGGEFDEMLTIFSLKAARRSAYQLAHRMRATPQSERGALLTSAESLASGFGQLLIRPPLRDRLLLAAASLFERNVSPRQLLGMLERD
jgi:uncharacterized protein DUF5995